eukprot:scaffold1064_cov85-Amphora_coffeaeformis.AAC.6
MKSPVLASVLVSCLVGMASSFAPTTSQPQPWSTGLPAKAGKKKGFGTTPEPPAPPKKKKPEPFMVESSSQASPPPPAPREEEEPNAGQKALQEMRRQRAEQKDAELRKVREMLQADEQLQQAPAAIPERVAQRMGKRMLPFVGLPLVGGMGCFVAFWYLATYKDLEFQPALVAFSTIAILALGLVWWGFCLSSPILRLISSHHRISLYFSHSFFDQYGM